MYICFIMGVSSVSDDMFYSQWVTYFLFDIRGHCGRDCMVVEFTTYVISANL